MSMPFLAMLVFFPGAMAYAAASDLVSMTISNRLCLLLFAGFIVCATLAGLSPQQFAAHVAAGALVLTLCFGLFAAGWIGGGDAKLAAVTALWFGFDQLVPYLAYAAIFGGFLTFAILTLRSSPLPDFAGWPWLRRLHSAKEGVPYGIALAFSALLVLPETPIWRAALAG